MRLGEPERLGDHAVERLDLAVIAIEQGQKAGLGARSSPSRRGTGGR